MSQYVSSSSYIFIDMLTSSVSHIKGSQDSCASRTTFIPPSRAARPASTACSGLHFTTLFINKQSAHRSNISTKKATTSHTYNLTTTQNNRCNRLSKVHKQICYCISCCLPACNLVSYGGATNLQGVCPGPLIVSLVFSGRWLTISNSLGQKLVLISSGPIAEIGGVVEYEQQNQQFHTDFARVFR